jgi:hypothetical protein
MEINSEEELDRFLGSLAKSVMKGASSLIKSPVGKMLGGALKSVAKAGLPWAGRALGTFIAPGIGTAIGGQLGSMASKLLEVGENETMGEEEAQFEAARRYVRWSAGTIRNAARAPRNLPPRQVVRSAAVASARRYAPSLLNDRRQSPWRGRRGPGWGAPRWSNPSWDAPDWGQQGGRACTCGAQQGGQQYGQQNGGSSWGDDDNEQETSGYAGQGSQAGRWVRRGRDLVLIGGAG